MMQTKHAVAASIIIVAAALILATEPTGQQVAASLGEPAVLGGVQTLLNADAKADAVFSWTRAAAVEEQWLDISKDSSFAPGTFTGTNRPPNPASTSYRTGDGSIGVLEACARYYWRINTLFAGQWSTSATGTFDTPCNCGRPCAFGGGVGIYDLSDNCIGIKEFYDQGRCCYDADCPGACINGFCVTA